MTVEVLIQGLVSGLLMGFVYALIAAGLSLIFGLMEIVNFAHGEFLMGAMFATFWAWALLKLDPLVSLPLTVLLLALFGLLVYHGLIRWILGAPMLAQIFATFGLIFVTIQYLQFVIGRSPLEAALSMLPLPLVMIPLARNAPKVAQKVGFRRLAPVGLLHKKDLPPRWGLLFRLGLRRALGATRRATVPSRT